MCHLAGAGIAASLELSCVTAALLLLGKLAEVCKQLLHLPVVQPQGFGKSVEIPAWCSQNPVVKPRLFANPSTRSISNTSGCSSGLDVGKCHGHSWSFDTCFPQLCGGSPASRSTFSSLPSFLQKNSCVLFVQHNVRSWRGLILYKIPGFWKEVTVLSELSPLSHLEWCSPTSEFGEIPWFYFMV